MGILWWRGKKDAPSPTGSKSPTQKPDPAQQLEVPRTNGAVEVPRPGSSLTILEFGSVSGSTDKVTLAGYCPVSDDIQPCRWEIVPASDDDAPQFRIVF